MGGDAERPVTGYPVSEYPLAERRGLWSSPLIVGSLVRGNQLASTVFRSPRALTGSSSRGSQPDRLRFMRGEDLNATELANPARPDDLIVTGYCFGYPPSTTAARITGTHG